LPQCHLRRTTPPVPQTSLPHKSRSFLLKISNESLLKLIEVLILWNANIIQSFWKYLQRVYS
jgi:hypothetical protein